MALAPLPTSGVPRTRSGRQLTAQATRCGRSRQELRLRAATRRGAGVGAAEHLRLMVVRGGRGRHPCSPETLLADSRSTNLQLVAMRCAAPRRDAVVLTYRVLTRLTKEGPMRLISIGL